MTHTRNRDQRIYDVMVSADVPMTSAQIAARLNEPVSGVACAICRLRARGVLSLVGMSPGKGGARRWRLVPGVARPKAEKASYKTGWTVEREPVHESAATIERKLAAIVAKKRYDEWQRQYGRTA